MLYKKQVIETIFDDMDKEIKVGDFVIYCTNSYPETVLAQYHGLKGGYLVFGRYGVFEDYEYKVKPSTIKNIVLFNGGK